MINFKAFFLSFQKTNKDNKKQINLKNKAIFIFLQKFASKAVNNNTANN